MPWRALSPVREESAPLRLVSKICGYGSQDVRSRPSTPPITESRVLSVNNWRTTRPWLAPSAARIANSRVQATERRRSKLATFTQAMSKANAPRRRYSSHLWANALENHPGKRTSHEADHTFRNIAAGMKSRGRYQLAWRMSLRAVRRATLQFPCVPSVCAGLEAEQLRAVCSHSPPSKRAGP